MGREIKRVPLDFNFPLGKSYTDAHWDAHKETCEGDEEGEHDGCDIEHQPPKGDGWQLWQTVSDGPISPVFADPDDLIAWMSEPVPVADRKPWKPEAYPSMPWDRGWRREVAERFVKGAGWMPSMMAVGGRALTTAETIDYLHPKREAE